MTTPYLQVTTLGLQAGVNASTGGFGPLSITTFKLGSNYNYTPDPSGGEIALHGAVVYSAAVSSYAIQTDGSLLITLSIPASAGPFTFGEIGIYTSTGVLLASTALQTPIVKYSSLSSNFASSITLQCYLQLGATSSVFNLTGSGGASSIPSGSVFDFGGTTAPSGFLVCDGSSYLTATYPALYLAIGTTWGGTGGTSGTFNVPNLQRKVTIGAGGTAVGPVANTVGATGGEETHVLSLAEMASHRHTFSGTTSAMSANATHSHSDSGHTHPIPVGGIAANQTSSGSNSAGLAATNTSTGYANLSTANIDHTHTYSGTTSGVGTSTAHNNMQPSAVMLKVIKI